MLGLTSITESRSYKYWVFFALAIGLFASVVDHGSVNIALPSIASALRIDLPSVQWVVIGYSLVISALLLLWGGSPILSAASESTSWARW